MGPNTMQYSPCEYLIMIREVGTAYVHQVMVALVHPANYVSFFFWSQTLLNRL